MPCPTLSDAPFEVLDAIAAWQKAGGVLPSREWIAEVYGFSVENLEGFVRAGGTLDEAVDEYLGGTQDQFHRLTSPDGEMGPRWAFMRIYRWILQAAADEVRGRLEP